MANIYIFIIFIGKFDDKQKFCLFFLLKLDIYLKTCLYYTIFPFSFIINLKLKSGSFFLMPKK